MPTTSNGLPRVGAERRIELVDARLPDVGGAARRISTSPDEKRPYSTAYGFGSTVTESIASSGSDTCDRPVAGSTKAPGPSCTAAWLGRPPLIASPPGTSMTLASSRSADCSPPPEISSSFAASALPTPSACRCSARPSSARRRRRGRSSSRSADRAEDPPPALSKYQRPGRGVEALKRSNECVLPGHERVEAHLAVAVGDLRRDLTAVARQRDDHATERNGALRRDDDLNGCCGWELRRENGW